MSPPTRREAIALRVRQYFTGKPCRKGHISARYTLTALCVQCSKDTQTAVRAKIRAQLNAIQEEA